MKKFTFKGVLDGFRSTVQPQQKPEQEIQETLRSEHFQLRKTFRHGFPHAPTALSYDPIQKLLAIGDKSGSLRILGRAGVDTHVRHEDESACAVTHIEFLVNDGALVTATADDMLHLWNFRQKSPQIVQSLKFQRERITYLHLPVASKWLYVGTEKGNIHVVHIETFTLSGYIINWNKAIDVLRKLHPGAVVTLADNPLDANKLLIAFECGQIVLWDLRCRQADMRWQSAEPLRSVAWHHEGKYFVSSHTDGSLCTWPLRPTPKPQFHSYPHAKTKADGKLESCKPIHKIDLKTTRLGETFTIFTGGLSMEKGGKSPCITVLQGKGTTVLEMEHPVIDFITMCESPWASEMQEPYAIAVLLENDLVIIDLLTPGFPCYESPYPMDLHESPVTCCTYLSDCPSDLVPAFYFVGRSSARKGGFSEREWPIAGGEWSPASCSYSEIIITGHQDGSIKFWDSSAGTLQVLYKLKTAKIFERPRTRSMDGVPDDDPLAVQIISLCAESRRLAVAGGSGHVILFKFKKTESSGEFLTLEIPIFYENVDEAEGSPECEFVPRSLPKPDSTDSDKKNDGMLKVRSGPQRKAPGFQAQLICLAPWTNGTHPGQITALSINSSYGLMAYGTEHGLVIVDIVQKVCLLNVASPDLYGAQDPYSRSPRSPKQRSDTMTDHGRSPSIDQYPIVATAAATTCSALPKSIEHSPLAADDDDDDDETPSRPVSPANEADEEETPTGEPLPPVPSPAATVDALDEMPKEKRGRSTSVWKGLNLKRRMSKVNMKISSTLSDVGRRSSMFYHGPTEGTPLSPVEISPESSESIKSPNCPSGQEDDTTPITDADLASIESSIIQSLSDLETGGRSTKSPCSNTDPVDSSREHTNTANSSDQESATEAIPVPPPRAARSQGAIPKNRPMVPVLGRPMSQPQDATSKRIEFEATEPTVIVKSLGTRLEGACISRPTELSLFDGGHSPTTTADSGGQTKPIDRAKRTRMQSVPNIKLSRQESAKLKELRSGKSSTAKDSSLVDMLRRFNKLDSSFSRSRSSSMSSLENVSSEAVTCLAFADSYTKKSDPTTLLPTLWVGTSIGSVLAVSLVVPEADVRKAQPVVVTILGGPVFRLKGSILSMSFLDCNGALIPYSYEAWKDDHRGGTPTKNTSRMSPTMGTAGDASSFSDRQFIAIISEKNARVIALPSQNCVYRQQIAIDSDYAVKAEIISLKDSVCLICYISTGQLMGYSLPSLRPLMNEDFLPLADLSFQTKCKQGIVDPMLSIWGQQLIVHEDTNQISKTFCLSNRGHGLYLATPAEIQKFTLCAEFCTQYVNEMIGELFIAHDMPEPPKESFLKGLFGGGVRSLDREELFGESSGKPNRSVAKHVPGPNLQELGQRASSATSEISRAHMLALERGDKLSQLEERTERMHNTAQEFGGTAHNLMLKYKDKKW